MKSWNELKWWESKECQATHEALNYYDASKWRSCPPKRDVYRALHETPLANVRVVIVGQDPYPTPGVANGLAFSVSSDTGRTSYPPTLVNIFQELVDDLGVSYPKTGDLTRWANQGVLLWNTSLTIGANKEGHYDLWRPLTEEVLGAVDEHRSGCVFVLWGRHAQSFLPKLLPSIQNKRHRVILSVHPSPLSARRGFFGSRVFSTANSFLKGDPIDWRL